MTPAQFAQELLAACPSREVAVEVVRFMGMSTFEPTRRRAALVLLELQRLESQ